MATPERVSFTVGSRVRASDAVRNGSGILYDPPADELSFTYREPGSVFNNTFTYPTDAEIVRDSTGRYHIDILLDQLGDWSFSWHNADSGNESVVEFLVTAVASLV